MRLHKRRQPRQHRNLQLKLDSVEETFEHRLRDEEPTKLQRQQWDIHHNYDEIDRQQLVHNIRSPSTLCRIKAHQSRGPHDKNRRNENLLHEERCKLHFLPLIEETLKVWMADVNGAVRGYDLRRWQDNRVEDDHGQDKVEEPSVKKN